MRQCQLGVVIFPQQKNVGHHVAWQHTYCCKANLSQALTRHNDELNKIKGIGRGTNLLWLADKKYFTQALSLQ
jgi:hypothetical protein